MTTILDLKTLDDSVVAEYLAILEEAVSNAEPNIDVSFGVIRTLLLHPAAQLAAVRAQEAKQLRDSVSYASLQVSASDVTFPERAAEVAANFGVKPQTAGLARGQITLTYPTDNPVFVRANTLFNAEGASFRTTRPFVSVTSLGVSAAGNDRLLRRIGPSTYAFDIDVVAVTPGSSGNIRQGTVLSLEEPDTRLIRAFATTDFIGGSAEDSPIELVNRIRDRITTPAGSTAASIQSLIRHDTMFPATKAVSVVGYGDPEMRRDTANVLGVGGGSADVYVRTEAQATSRVIEKDCQVVEETEGMTIWQTVIGRDDYPGFWEVSNVARTLNPDLSNTSGIRIVSDTRGYDLSPILGVRVPQVADVKYLAYSRYQTAVVRFVDPGSPISSNPVGTVKPYQITLSGLPNVAGIQSVLSGRSHRPVSGDILVRAAVPCLVGVTITLAVDPGATIPSVQSIKAAVASSVNTSSFTSKLYGSQLSDASYDVLPQGVAVEEVDMRCAIIAPTGDRFSQRSTQAIEIPYRPDLQLSWRTAAFFSRPELVNVNGNYIERV